ncbi:N-acetylglucosaminyl transferase component-domain-containing protein [Lenzites betulinus]|nr:N-acetylglucosaminyl transferase component-domain-containing protein [Lenzites betulinus]
MLSCDTNDTMNRIVFWPSDLPPHSEGICFGWRQPLLVVIGVLPLLQESDRAVHEQRCRDAIASAIAQPHWAQIQKLLSRSPAVLGYYEAAASTERHPKLRLNGALPGESEFELILYQRHRRQSMRSYTFDFSELDILPSQEVAKAQLPIAVKNATAALEADFTRSASPHNSTLDDEVLLQINFAQLFADIVQERLRPVGLAANAEPFASRESHRRPYAAVPQLSNAWHLLQKFLSLRNISTTVDQLDVRLEQGAYVVGELPQVYHNKARTVVSISRYIKFHNCVWLILNDVIIGVAFGSFLCENQHVLARILDDVLQNNLVARMELALLWLNSWPAGLKLNTELSQFYCHTLVGVVSAWGWLLARVAPYFPAFVWLIGVSGCCGMTMIVSLLSDALSVLTLHLYACYYISATVFSHQLSLAGSLWNLFRGKRHNVLRNRIDSWDYDLDQLLLGTILFTLLAFLYPTVLTYYALFATARLAIMMIHAIFDTVTALLNHFPLFALLLRVKDPLRLPGGVCIQRSRAGPLVLTSQTAPLSSIFRHYAHLVGRLAAHYHPLRMLRQLASGRLITPIPRSTIRYNMIPIKVQNSDPGVPNM